MNILISLAVGLLSSGFLGALLGLGGSILGGLFGNKDQKRMYKEQAALTSDIRNKYLPQEQAGKNAAVAGLQDTAGFYDPYMKNGSPFLKQQQRASAETINKGYDEALGQSRSRLAQQGFGYAPSGISAAVESSLGRDRARSTSEAYLNNLLENEKVKFQAAAGKTGVQSTIASQFDPSKYAQLGMSGGQGQAPPSSLPSIFSAGADLLGSFTKKKSTSPISFNPGTLMPWQ